MSTSLLVAPHHLRSLALAWLDEDCPEQDVGGTVVGEGPESAVLLCKAPGASVLCGRPFVDAVFGQLGCRVEWEATEGHWLLDTPCRVATVHGPANGLLLGERVALNVLSRASGVATAARRAVDAAREAGWPGKVAGTRKTTPGFRRVEKYALVVGGADTHRFNLSSMVMLKDNHTWAAGSVQQAVRAAKKTASVYTKLLVECRSLTEAREAIDAGCDAVMLDNFTPETLGKTARDIKASNPRIVVEASGGITDKNMAAYFDPNVDVISCGCLTQGYGTVDFSLKLVRGDRDPFNPLV